MRGQYKRYVPFGPGGIRCPCCGPAPGQQRKKVLRAVKRAERATMQRQLNKDLE